jgi:predicted ATPase
MNTFERLTIEGFRRLFSAEVEMRPLTVMIGANGVGKSSFLEIFSLLAASAKGQLQSKISELGGLSQIVTLDRADSVSISLLIPIENQEPFNYSLKLATKGQFYEIDLETLSQQRNPAALQPFKYIESRGLDVKYFSPEDERLLRPNWQHNPYETSLAQVPKMYREPETLRQNLASCSFYKAWELNLAPQSPIRLPQSMQPMLRLKWQNGRGKILNFTPMQIPMTLKLGCYLFGQKFRKYQEAIERFLAVLPNRLITIIPLLIGFKKYLNRGIVGAMIKHGMPKKY